MSRYVGVVILAALAAWGTGCSREKIVKKPEAAPGGAQQEGGAPEAPLEAKDAPLLLEDAPPLLLEEGEAEFLPPSGSVADNSRCHVCHMNYVREEIALVHARADMGCVDCHGDCDEHIADESWASGGNGTPPSIMYTRDKVNPFCMECHPKDEIDTEEHSDFLAGTGDKKHCTDCHGEHRLPVRKCKWK